MTSSIKIVFGVWRVSLLLLSLCLRSYMTGRRIVMQFADGIWRFLLPILKTQDHGSYILGSMLKMERAHHRNWISKLLDLDQPDEPRGRYRPFDRQQKRLIEQYLNVFQEVTWDRFFVVQSGWFTFYGWIQRPGETKRDFAVLEIVDNMPYSITTSSLHYADNFANRLNFPAMDHERVEDYFKNDVQCTHLGKNNS